MAVHIGAGRRTQGKTTLVDHLVQKLTRQVRFSPRITLPARGQIFATVPSYETFSELMTKKETVTLVPDVDVDQSFMDYAALVARWYRHHEHEISEDHSTLGFVVDEARFDGVRESKDLDWLIRCTQAGAVHVYFTVHRPIDLHPDIRAIADFWYVFRITQKRDLDILEDECDDVIAERAPTLQPRELWVYDVSAGKRAHWPASKSEHWKPAHAPAQRPMITGADDMARDMGDFDLT